MTRRTAFLLASFALYGLSLVLPAVNGHAGIECLVAGWFGFGSGVGFSWLANLSLPAAWTCIGANAKSAGLVLCALTVVLMLSILANPFMMASTSGATTRITDFGPGYFVWILSALAAGLSALFSSIRRTGNPRRDA